MSSSAQLSSGSAGPHPDPGPQWRVSSGQPAPSTVERLLRSLPEWFGIESAIQHYVESAHHLATYLVWPEAAARSDQPVGVLLVTRHFPDSAEIHLMAVERDRHRQGVGRALVAALESDLRREGAQLLQVKTLGASHPDPGYQLTRRFYQAIGFLPLEESEDLWPGNLCLIMVKPL